VLIEILIIVISAVVAAFLLTVFFGAPFLPSRRSELETAFTELYPLSPKDTLLDVGSGDGIVLRVASAHKPKRLIGYELNPFLVFISRIRCRKIPNTQILCRNFLYSQIPDGTTVIYIFGLDHLIPKLAKKIQKTVQKTGRPIHLISYAFYLTDRRPTKKLGAYYLYKFTPDRTLSERTSQNK